MIPPLDYLDRYRNEGTRTYSPHADYSEAEDRYRPQSELPGFDLAALVLPADAVNVYTANPAPELRARYLPPGGALFCIHPQVLHRPGGDPYVQRALDLGEVLPPIPVAPSSSTRTLFVQGGPVHHALKVHFPFRVSRYGRKMRDEVVEQAVNVSRELETGSGDLDPDFAFLREVLGLTQVNLDPASARGENWGYLVREMTPFPGLEGGGGLDPGFALYGRDLFDPSLPPLLFQLAESRSPVSFAVEDIMLPVIRHWVRVFLRFGFILEPHGQNTLLELGPEGGVRRIVHRDLNLGIDMRRRGDIGLPDTDLNDYNRMTGGEFASIAYDKFMGGHFFDRIVSVIREAESGVEAEDLRGPCREEFEALFPEHREYLPRTAQYFSEERDRYGKPLLMDTGKAPKWRP